MRQRRFLPLALVFVLIGCAAKNSKAPEAAQTPVSSPLCVMTFNLKFAAPTGPNSWPVRRPVMADCIRSVSPDLIGTQEGLYSQLKNMAADLPEYAWIGTGRDGGSRGEFMAIFYRKDRFEPVEYDHFWLSDTPNVIASSTWGNVCRRMVTWVRFRDRRSGAEFYFMDTHLDHQVQAAREKAAELIRNRVVALKTKLPIVLVGDFNAQAKKNKAYDILVADDLFTDAWFTAAQRKGEDIGTIHDYKGPQAAAEHIDWILHRGAVTPDATQVITFNKNGQYPSDHFPVVAWMRLGPSK